MTRLSIPLRGVALATLGLAFALVGTSAAAFASEPFPRAEGDGEEAAVTGELHIDMNSDYAAILVNDSEWGAVEFERSGKRAIIKNLPLDQGPIRVSLTPSYDTLEPVALEVRPDEFKKKRRKRAYYMVAKKKVKFIKRKDAPAEPKPDAPRPDAPKPGDDSADDDEL